MAEKLTKAQRKPKGAKGEAWGLLNPWGDVWTYETFETSEDALAYVRKFWSGTRNVDLSQFTAVRVRVHVTALPALQETTHDR